MLALLSPIRTTHLNPTESARLLVPRLHHEQGHRLSSPSHRPLNFAAIPRTASGIGSRLGALLSSSLSVHSQPAIRRFAHHWSDVSPCQRSWGRARNSSIVCTPELTLTSFIWCPCQLARVLASDVMTQPCPPRGTVASTARAWAIPSRHSSASTITAARTMVSSRCFLATFTSPLVP